MAAATDSATAINKLAKNATRTVSTLPLTRFDWLSVTAVADRSPPRARFGPIEARGATHIANSLPASAQVIDRNALHPIRQPTAHRHRSNNVPASIKTAVAIASGLLVLGAGVGVAATAFADTTTPAPNPTSAPTIPAPDTPLPNDPPPGTERPDWPTSPEQEAQEAQEEALIKVLSEMLGVDEAQVKAALDQIRAAYEAQGPAVLDPYLDQAVQAGILTPEEADAVRQAIEQGWVGVGPR
jgi:hypothetical protein